MEWDNGSDEKVEIDEEDLGIFNLFDVGWIILFDVGRFIIFVIGIVLPYEINDACEGNILLFGWLWFRKNYP